ncbi:MAG: MutS2/Smr-associated SH3 domain-containing protein, partial [Thermoanaerobaculia bacterium]
MAFFPELYADIGDPQDLAKDLSSFSAHMTQMIRLLEEASLPRLQDGEGAGTSEPLRRPPKALILLDELVTSTDPAEGAALAEALLLRLSSLGLKVVVTTHYNQLKALAQTTPGFMNASVEFDVSRLAPTYRLLMGLPGGSSAIEIAGRLGLEEEILEDALQRLRREDRGLERLLGDLQEKQRRLDDDLARIATLKADAERSAREAAEITERLRLAEREDRKSVKKKLTEELLNARAQVQSVMEGLKHERTLLKAKEAKQRLAELDTQARGRLVKPAETVAIEHVKAGDRVEIVSLGAVGTVLESPRGKKRVRVRVGEAEMSVPVSGLIGLAAGVSEETVRGAGGIRQAGLPRLASSVEPETTTVLEFRGKAADDALEVTVAALDRAPLAGVPGLRIIHGHGT